MLVEKNSSTKIIKDRMNFKFEDLELVGKCDRVIQKKWHEKVQVFSLDHEMPGTIFILDFVYIF